MARNINLNSSDWCDIIFEGKNKAYGAYDMRQTSSRRHLIAFGFVTFLTLMLVTIPKIIDTITPATNPDRIKNTDVMVISDIPIEKPQEEIIVEPRLAPPPPPLARSIQFTPPIITQDEEVTDENSMRTQEDLRDFNGLISTQTVLTDNIEGVDIREVDPATITGNGTGTGIIPDYVEQMPQYPGGNQELARYLKDNMKYPVPAIEAGIEGRVFLKFVVGKDGGISNVQVLKGIDPSCDKEAVRVIENMPRWIAGMQNGNPVAVYFTLPVLFKLSK